MTKFSLLFDSPPWLIGLGILIGAAYAFILYYKKPGPWGKQFNTFLAILRFLLVTQLTLLLFGPLIRQIRNTYEPPAIVLAVDNSSSVAEMTDSARLMQLLEETFDGLQTLEKKGYITEIRTLDPNKSIQSPSEVSYHELSTDLSSMISSIQNDYESRNLSSVILVSDGLYNRGINPTYRSVGFPIYTIGVGDTVQRPDINLNTLLYNKIAYQGNQFPIVAEILSSGLSGREIIIRVENRGQTLATETVGISSNEQFDQVRFTLEATATGVQRYTVSAMPLEDEFTTVNNVKEAFIEIIEGRENILIAARAPHPDLKALKTAIEENKNYRVYLYIPGFGQLPKEKFDAAILHQIPQ